MHVHRCHYTHATRIYTCICEHAPIRTFTHGTCISSHLPVHTLMCSYGHASRIHAHVVECVTCMYSRATFVHVYLGVFTHECCVREGPFDIRTWVGVHACGMRARVHQHVHLKRIGGHCAYRYRVCACAPRFTGMLAPCV